MLKQIVSSRNYDVLVQIFSYICISKYVISQLYKQTKGKNICDYASMSTEVITIFLILSEIKIYHIFLGE
jgi:hypothetical protein